MTLTITITVPAPAFVARPATWRTVRPFVPVLLAGAEQVVPGLGVVVALVGLLGLGAAVEATPAAPPAETAAVPVADEEPALRGPGLVAA
ncbi:hypothetical protein [Actinomycetospora atypica]|uniref:Uncharacterized protein n=1 Tax=Actinomycetospora atypica TaxID=1290095 RepID=A0ABV9YUC2_9PSEU